MTRLSVTPFKRENQLAYIYWKRETRTTNEPHQQITITEHQIPDLGQVQTDAAGLNVQIGTNLHPYVSNMQGNSRIKFNFIISL